MIGAIFEFLKNLFGATQAVASEVQQRDAELNAPEIKDNAAAKTEQAIKADATEAVADKDTDKVRKMLSE